MNSPVVVIQRNPTSGVPGKRAELLSLIRTLKKKGFQPRLFSSRERLDRWVADPARKESIYCLVSAGGDGTFQDLINRHPHQRVTLFPLGTENVMARYLKIPHHGEHVAEMIARGHERTIDLGQYGDRIFVLMASVGFDAEIIHRAHAWRRGHTSRWNYLWPIAKALWDCRSRPLRVTIDGGTPLAAEMAVVVNIPRYALNLNMASQARDDDGVLEVRLFQGFSAWRMWWYFLHLCRGTHEALPDVLTRQGKDIEISGDRVAVQVDGDPAGHSPVRFSIRPHALKVIVP
ncbi:MAG: diacylglycerol kinase family protein [Planctomycetales bacterium]